MAERHVHPMEPEEFEVVVHAVKAFMSVLPPGDDQRGQERALLVKALEKLEKHWCPWCPVEVRDLGAVAHNAAVNYGSNRERKKMDDLLRTINHYDPALDAHFRAVNEYMASRPLCARLPGCQIKPGGHWHDPECPVEKERRV